MENISNAAKRYGLSRNTVRKLIEEKVIFIENGHYTFHFAVPGHYVTLSKACTMTNYSKEGLRHKRVTGQIRAYKVNEKFYLYDIAPLEVRHKSPRNRHYLRAAEAAYLLGIKESSIRYYSKRGEISNVKDANGHRRFDINELQMFFKAERH